MKFSKEHLRKYAENSSECPFCGGELSASDPDVDGPIIWSNVRCLQCGREWRDVYELVAVETKEGGHQRLPNL